MPSVVCYDVWLDNNEDHILDIYNILQEICSRTGRQIFDRDKCNFANFCQLAYNWSTLYTNDSIWMQEDDINDDEGEYVSDS